MPRVPAIPRDNRPNGFTRRMASARPGASRSMADRVPSGREVARTETGASGRDHQADEALRRGTDRLRHRVHPVGDDLPPDDGEPRPGQLLLQCRPAPVLACAGRDPVRHDDDTGQRWLIGRHRAAAYDPTRSLQIFGRYATKELQRTGRRYRNRAIPSVPATCGNNSAPRPSGVHGSPGEGMGSSAGCAVAT